MVSSQMASTLLTSLVTSEQRFFVVIRISKMRMTCNGNFVPFSHNIFKQSIGDFIALYFNPFHWLNLIPNFNNYQAI